MNKAEKKARIAMQIEVHKTAIQNWRKYQAKYRKRIAVEKRKIDLGSLDAFPTNMTAKQAFRKYTYPKISRNYQGWIDAAEKEIQEHKKQIAALRAQIKKL